MAQHKLVIAEKPSVAQSLAAVIGATVRKDGYLEGNGWRVSWCVGHLAGMIIFSASLQDNPQHFKYSAPALYISLGESNLFNSLLIFLLPMFLILLSQYQ